MKDYILIADSQQLFKESLQNIIDKEIDSNRYIYKQCCIYADLLSTIKSIDGKISLVILSTNLNDLKDINVAISAIKSLTAAHILVITTINDESFAKELISFGITSYALKDTSHIDFQKVIKDTLTGKQCIKLGQSTNSHNSLIKNKLTARQYRVLIEVMNGLANKQIAYKLKISESTVKIHISSILEKLHVNNRTEAVIFFYKTSHNIRITNKPS